MPRIIISISLVFVSYSLKYLPNLGVEIEIGVNFITHIWKGLLNFVHVYVQINEKIISQRIFVSDNNVNNFILCST